MNKYSGNEFDLFSILRLLYLRRIKILIITLCFSFFGLLIAINTKNLYNSSIIFTPTNSANNISSGISDIASIAGINLNNQTNSNTLSIITYPIIFDNIFFKRDVLNIKLNEGLLLKDFLLIENTTTVSKIINLITSIPNILISMPSKIFSSFTSKPKYLENNFDNEFFIDSKYIVSNEESLLFDKLKSLITINVNNKNSYITISSNLSNPIYSSIVTLNTQKILEKYIINHNIKAYKELINFIQKNYDEKKIEFDQTQRTLAEFKDKNQVISSSRFNIELFVLQNKFDLINNIFQKLESDLQSTKIQLTKDTPVFTILKEPDVPLTRFSPNRTMIIIIWTLVGLIISTGYILLKDHALTFLKKINNN